MVKIKELEILKNEIQIQERNIFCDNSAEVAVDDEITTTEREEAGKDKKDCNPNRDPFIPRLINGTICTSLSAYNKLAVCVKCNILPSLNILDFVAFYPPSPWKWYYLSYYNIKKGRRYFGNAEQCYGKPNLRIEPVTNYYDRRLLTRIESFAERTEAFIVESESGNHIVGAKIRAKTRKQSHKVILVANHNACDLGLTLNCSGGYLTTYQHPNPYDVYIFDYSGYGLSTGKASEKAVYDDIEAVYDYIVTERKDPELEIILFGISIGTAVVTDLATKNLPYIVGVVLIAPLTSVIRHVVRNKPPKKTSPHVDCFRVLDKAPLVKVPLLCIHGLNDEMMPPRNSMQIYLAAPFGISPLFIQRQGHLGILHSPQLGERILIFIEKDIEKWKLEVTR